MKRPWYALVIMLFVLNAGFCFSSGFSGQVHTGDNITVGNEVFNVKAADIYGSNLIITSNNSNRASIVLHLNETKTDMGYTFFYSERNDENEAMYKKYNITGVYDENKSYVYKITIEQLAPSATVTRSVSSKDIAVGDTINLSITIKNNGDVQLPVSYSETLPSYYQKNKRLMVLAGDVEKEYLGASEANRIQWAGSLNKDDTVKLTQELKLVGLTLGNNNIDLNNGTLEYSYLGKEYTVTAKPVKVSYYYPLKTTISFRKKTVMVDEESAVEIRFKNEAEDEIEIFSAKAGLSGNAKILNTDELDGWERDQDRLVWHSTLEGGESRSFNISFMTLKSGNITLDLDIESRHGSLETSQTFSSDALAEIDRPSVQLDMASAGESNEDFEAGYVIDNKESDYDFYDVHVDISSPLFDDEHYLYKKLSAGNSVSNNFTFELPWVYSDQNFDVDLSCNYSTVHGESFHSVINKSIHVKKLSFEKAFSVVLAGYNFTEGDNSSKYDNLLLTLNITCLNCSGLQEASIMTGVLGSEELLQLSADDLASLNSSLFELHFEVPKNQSKEGLSAESDAKYMKNGSFFYFIEKFSLGDSKKKKVKQASLANPGSGASAVVQKDDPFKYMNEKSTGHVKLKVLTGSPKQIAVIIVVFLGLFFSVSFVTMSMKKKKARSLRDGTIFTVFNKINSTEKLESSHQAGVSKQTASGFQQLSGLVPMPTSNLEILEDYINQSIKSGKSKDRIKQELIDKGWLKDIIEVYLK